MDPNCKDIVGGDVETVLEIPGHVAAAPENQPVILEPVAASAHNAASRDDPHGINNFFIDLPDKRVLVITTPFRKGQHVAQHPGDFLPIIENLEKIHKEGYVHGDVRSYNTAFPENEGDQGYLIDFDYSGKAGEVVYPQGYNRLMPDGYRIGGKAKIEKWHDWHALGALIFEVHRILEPEAKDEQQLWSLYLKCKEYSMALETDPPAQRMQELKELLSDVQEKGWKVKAAPRFQQWLNETDCSDLMTKVCATGSPSKRHIDLLLKFGEPPIDGIDRTKNA